MGYSLEDIETKVIQVLSDKASIAVDGIHPDSHLVDDLGMDSLDAAESVFEFEETYDIDIPDEEIPKLAIVQDIVTYLARRLKVR